jgi:lysophospholipase L1-like esterase
MTVHDDSGQRHRRIRWAGLGIGVALAAIGLAADIIGLSRSPGIGALQLLLMALGAAIVLIVLLGRRTASVYRGTALIALNTVMLLVAVEFCAMLALWLLKPEEAPPKRVAYYAAQQWSEAFLREYNRAHRKTFHPYVMWRTAPFHGKYINVDDKGIRQTDGSHCVDDAYRVFAFGGSTVWGVGSPDWGTIPSYLTATLEARLGRPICMVNFGEHGFVSGQSVVQLIAELEAGNIPQLVVFYDGINDTYSAVLTGVAGTHYEIGRIRSRLEGQPKPPTLAWLQERAIYRLAALRSKPAPAPEVALTDDLAAGVVENYLSNYRIVSALAREYGFDYRFFWQPNLIVTHRALNREEDEMRGRFDPEAAAFIANVYARIHASCGAPRDNLYDLSEVFDLASIHPYVDWMHLTPEGNQRIAQAIADSFGE